MLAQGAAGSVGHDQERKRTLALKTEIEQGQDVGMAQAQQGAGRIEEGLQVGRGERAGSEGLEDHRGGRGLAPILGKVDLAEAASAEQMDELIAIERLTGEIREHQAALLSSNRGRTVRVSKRVADCGVDMMEAV